jgi:DNA recombination protein RmuC
MDALTPLILGLAIGIVLGGLIGWLLARSRRVAGATGLDPALAEAQHAAALSELRAQEQAERARLTADLAAIQATASALTAQVEAQQRQYQEALDRHRVDAAAQVERDRAESKVLQALTPVQESLRTMQHKVTELETQRSTQYGAIAEQLTQTRISNEQIRATTESLASALRNNGTRGVWGEAQLRNVVEAAGLTNRVDFDLQSSITSDACRGRPDMIVRLPGG